jgi:hypothetical protein
MMRPADMSIVQIPHLIQIAQGEIAFTIVIVRD